MSENRQKADAPKRKAPKTAFVKGVSGNPGGRNPARRGAVQERETEMSYFTWPGVGYSTSIAMDELTKPARKAAGAARNLKKRREAGTDNTTFHGMSKKSDAMNKIPPAMMKVKKGAT